MAAHVPMSEALFQLRNFGSPMMIIVSALATTVVASRRKIDAIAFWRRRLFRVTVQPWLFLTLFFAVVYAVTELRSEPFPYRPSDVLRSYTFQDGIGYVWIFKVYVIVTLLTPPLLALRGPASRHPMLSIGMLLAVIVVDTLLRDLTRTTLGPTSWPGRLDGTVFTIVPFAVLFAYGLLLPELTNRQVALAGLSSCCAFLLLALLHYRQAGHFVPTESYKYPPEPYYLSYGFACVNAVYLVVRLLPTLRRGTTAIGWISTNMLWVYLWHIMGLFVWREFIPMSTPVAGSAFAEFAFVLSFGVGLAWLQRRLVETLAAGAGHATRRRMLTLLH